MTLPAGKSGIQYTLNFCGQTPSKKRLRAELYIDPPGGRAEAVFDALEAHRREIDAKIKENLPVEVSWERLPGKQACRVAVYSPFVAAVSDTENWPMFREWVLEAVGELRTAIGPAVKNLK
jgi:hypothetical protein